MPMPAESPESSRGIDRLIEEGRRGSPEALGVALESFRPDLVLLAGRELGRDLRAKCDPADLVQETLLKAQRDFAAFGGRTGDQLRAWLAAILRHSLLELRRHYRCAGRDVAREESLRVVEPGRDLRNGRRPDASSPTREAIGRERAAKLAEALTRLPERDRLVVTWKHDEGCTFEEVGRRLGCSLVSARNAWLLALERLWNEIPSLSEDSSLGGGGSPRAR